MQDRPYKTPGTYKVVVEVTYTIEVPITARNEEDAIEMFEKVLHKHDDYEIVNRSTGRKIEIVEIKETNGT